MAHRVTEVDVKRILLRQRIVPRHQHIFGDVGIKHIPKQIRLIENNVMVLLIRIIINMFLKTLGLNLLFIIKYVKKKAQIMDIVIFMLKIGK